jgi:hypothetical protein
MDMTDMIEQVIQIIFDFHAVIALIRATEMGGHMLQQVSHFHKSLITFAAAVSLCLISMEVITFLKTGRVDQQTGFRFERLFAFSACSLLQVNPLPVDSFQLLQITGRVTHA